MSNFFMNISLQAWKTKAKMHKWDYIKLKSFCTAKDTTNRTKWHPTVWENIFMFQCVSLALSCLELFSFLDLCIRDCHETWDVFSKHFFKVFSALFLLSNPFGIP